MIEALRDYQTQAAQSMLTGNAIIAYSVGLGKTPIGVYANILAGSEQVLIVSPLNLKAQWMSHIAEIERLYGRQAAVDVSDQRLPKVKAGSRTYTIAHPESLRKDHPSYRELVSKTWDTVCVDEAHRFSNPQADQSIGLRRLKTSRRWMLTGSFIRDKVFNLYGLLNWVYPERFNSQIVFNNTYCEMVPGFKGVRAGGLKSVAVRDEKGRQRMSTEPTLKLLRYNTQGILFVKTAEDVGLQLPESNFVDVTLDMDEGQAKLYTEVQREQIVYLTQQIPDFWDWVALDQHLDIPNAAARFTYLQRVTSDPQRYRKEVTNTKVVWLEDFIEGTDRPALVFTRFTDSAALIEKTLKQHNVTGWTVGTYDSLAEGLNLQQYNHTIMWDLPLRRIHYEQGCGRTRRMGQAASHVTYFRPLCRGTLDFYLRRAIEDKQAEVDAVTLWLRNAAKVGIYG